MYLGLFLLVIMGLVGCFMAIKWQQKALDAKELAIDAELTKKQEKITKAEELQTKRSQMWKTALTTAELIEPVLRSVILAELTNILPEGTSFLNLNVIQTESKSKPAASNFKKKKGKKNPEPVCREKLVTTGIELEGIAPSDLQVAMYLQKLNSSQFFNNAVLIESKEHKTSEKTIRQFKMTAMLDKNLHLSARDIEGISNSKAVVGAISEQGCNN
jgi:Tfp pilus assembly protein PilN